MFVAICEDNDIEREELLQTLKGISIIKDIESFSEPSRLLSRLSETKYDLILLDIMMPSMDGIETAKAIRQACPNVYIVFVTGFACYTLKAFSVYATDYLVKPFNRERLEKTIRLLNEKLTLDNRVIELKTQNAVYRVKQSDIILIEKELTHCKVYSERFTYDVVMPIKHFEAILDNEKFATSHAGFIINSDKISSIEAKGNLSYEVHFFNTEKTALISRGKRDKLLQAKRNKSVLL